MSRITIRGTAMTAAAAVAGSAAILGVNAWAAEPEEKPAAADTTAVAPKHAAVLQNEQAQQQPWQLARVGAVEDQQQEVREEARERREARERAQARREAAQERREAQRRQAAAARADRSERESVPSGSPRDIARAMLDDHGWGADQFGCLDSLWERESSWDPNAENPSSGAYGIPQALPGSKMAEAGSDWETNPATQIEWGLGYIEERYGSPCGAWEHSESNGWY